MCPQAISDWRPSTSVDYLRQRADVIAALRAFFAERELWEVETPILGVAGNTEPGIRSLSARCNVAGLSQQMWLHTSPEFAMKRLLAAGSGAIFQIVRVFRDGEVGRLHNLEFTLLEWYRPGFDTTALMTEVAALIDHILGPKPYQRLSYRQAFLSALAIDPFCASDTQLQRVCEDTGLVTAATPISRNQALEYLMATQVAPALADHRCFVYDFPAEQASYARIRMETPAVAERFELSINGIEIANGYQELIDANEQRERFEAEQHARQDRGLDFIPMDERLVAALDHGLPVCAGVAVGVDRLVMLALGMDRISDVIAFAADRA